MKRKSLLFVLLMALFMPFALHAQQSLPYEYGFEDQNLSTDGWTTSNLESGSQIMQMGGSYGYVFGFKWTTNPPQYLISPELTGTGNGVYVSFIYSCYMSSYPETFQVGYSTTTNATNAFTWDTEVTVTNVYSNQFLTYEKQFPAGTKYVAIKCTSNDMYYLFVDMISFTVPNACAKPTNLTVNEVGSRTANISWASDASSWQICINDDESHLIDVNQTSYTLTSLTPDTPYTVKVRTNCGNNSLSAWSSEISFTTDVACPAPENLAANDITATTANVTWTGSASNYTLRYREIIGFIYDFESAEPWTYTDFSPCTTYDGDGGTTYGFSSLTFTNQQYTGACIAFQNGISDNMSAHNGNAFGVMFNSAQGQSNDWFILPELTIQNGDVFSFWGREITNQYGDEIVNVGIYGSTEGTFAAYLEEELAISETEWTEHVYDLSAYAGQTIRLALNCVSNDVFGFMFDDVFVGNPTINWISTVSNATSPYALSSLTPESTYEVQVQAVCGGQDGSSVWSSTTFTTMPTCPAPTNLTFSDITTTGAVVTWTGDANSYNIMVNDVVYNNVTSPYPLTGLTMATEYTIQVQSICSSNNSAWTKDSFFTALCEPENMCEITFELTDSYGDTWNGNYILVVDAETMTIIDYVTNDYDNYSATGASGAYTQTKTVSVCNGREVYFLWYSGGSYSYPGETSWVIKDVNGDEITSGSGSSDLETYDILYQYTVDCTVSNCHKPTDITISAIGPTTATLSWTENGEATSWVIVREDGGPRPITITTYDNPYTFTGDYALTPETEYTVRVRPVCEVNKWSDDVVFFTNNVFMTDGNWNDGSHWYTGSVPAEGNPVTIQANITIPAGYTAIADEITLDGGSITVADGGQLRHNTDDLEVTMQKNVEPYTNTNSTSNYYLVAFPFNNYIEVPETMTATEGTDFYMFDNTEEGEEWQNSKTVAIDEVSAFNGYLYANPATSGTLLSLAGPTYSTPEYSYGRSRTVYYDETENAEPGWRLFGNPYTCDAYIYGKYGSSLFEMEVMYYDENGDMQTITCGPVPPMQAFFVKITTGSGTQVWFLAEPYDLSSKKGLQEVGLEEQVSNTATVLGKVAFKPAVVLGNTKDEQAKAKKGNGLLIKEFKPVKK